MRVFADGADLDGIRALAADAGIAGFTTNPTLMRKAGISDYERFAHDALALVGERPISFEVFSDDHADMERQALKIAGWGDNVYVKIPVTNTQGVASEDLLRRLVAVGVKVNVTGLMTLEQVEKVADAVAGDVPSNISVFAGRVADTGVDPVPLMTSALAIMAEAAPSAELIWASPREVLNIVQADQVGCHIITVTHDLLKKLSLLGHDHTRFSLETVRMFHDDASAAGFTL
ncbi:transaldolase [Conexibacter woesei]|uniref:transaldolase n=1 Tax=Conexibacter woesei TaxID=191495 RepID=UPI0002E98B20|nr:transaldolase [Conexibacter woesei]